MVKGMREMDIFEQKRILVTGGTGSLGKVLVRHLLSGRLGVPKQILVFSRDEAKQHVMRQHYLQKKDSMENIAYQNSKQLLAFKIGDVRDIHSVSASLRNADVVFNAAALKQVPNCEYFPFEAVQTNIVGAENIVRAIRENNLDVETVVGVSTDKACKPVNVMGMTKAIQERVFMSANLDCPRTRFICVRYGNVLASRGSVIPFFREQIKSGGPVTITDPDMTRFLLSLEQAVETIFGAVADAKRGETFIPKVKSAKVADVADVLIGNRPVKKVVTGVRPGEKVHEILVSEEEAHRTYSRGKFLAIQPILPEVTSVTVRGKALEKEYCSADHVMTRKELERLLRSNKLMVEDEPVEAD